MNSRGCSSACLDSQFSDQEPLECTSRLGGLAGHGGLAVGLLAHTKRAAGQDPRGLAVLGGLEEQRVLKRRRLSPVQGCESCPGGESTECKGSDDYLSGSLCCAETREFMEEADCSSLEADEGFVVYQSPLSLRPQGLQPGAAAGEGAAGPDLPTPQPVLADLQPRPLCDPDLEEMLSVLCDTETELQPSASYMDQHGPRISPELYLDASMRKTATSWLVEVAAEFGLHQETLFLATALLDRFLSAAKGVPRTQLQLVGVACMLIAAKHEEEMHPSVLDFTNIADNCFMPADLLRMEAVILDCLSFRVNTPTMHTFLSMYKQALGLQPRTCALASYFTELAMLEYELLHLRPSHVASAAMLLAKLYMNDIQGISHMPAVTNYSTDDLQPCMHHLLRLQHEAHAVSEFTAPTSPYLAVRDKYRSHQWFCVANITPLESLPTVLPSSAHPAMGKPVRPPVAGAAK